MSFRGQLLKAGIDSDGKIVTVYKNDGRLDIATASSETSGTIRSANIVHTVQANSMSLINETLRVSLESEYYTGDWSNAIVGRIDYGDAGDARGGMAAAICAEMNMPAKSYASIGGPCYSLDCEFNCPTSFVAGDRATYPIAFLKFGLWGGAKGQFDDEGYVFHADGLTAGAGHVLSANSRTLRVNIGGTDKYLYLSDTEDDLGAMVMDSVTFSDGGTITDASNVMTLTDETIKLVASSGITLDGAITLDDDGTITDASDLTGALTLNGTGDITMRNGATIANASANVMTITEPTITLAGSTKINLDGDVDISGALVLDTAFTTGVSIAADGTTALEVTSDFSGADMIVLAGSASDNGIEITGSCTDSAIQTGTGTFGTGLKLGGTNGAGISIGGTYDHGIVFTEDPVAGDVTNSFINIGDYNTGIAVAPTTANMFGVMHNVTMTTNVAYWYQAYYTKITTSGTTTQTSVAGDAIRMVIGSSLDAVYGIQCHTTLSGTNSIATEAISVSAYVNLASGATITSDRVCALQAMIEGAGGTVTGDSIVAYIANAGTASDTDAIVELKNQSACTATTALVMDLDGTVTYAFDFEGTVSDGWTSGDGAVTQADEYVKIPVKVKGVTPTLYILAAETWS